MSSCGFFHSSGQQNENEWNRKRLTKYLNLAWELKSKVVKTTFRPICPPAFFRCLLSKFLKQSLMTFIIKGFRTIVFIFIVISTTFRPICPPAFFRCLSYSRTYTELRTTFFIESTGVACSDSISHNRVRVLSIPVLLLACSQDWTCRWLSPKKLREPTLITVTPCGQFGVNFWDL